MKSYLSSHSLTYPVLVLPEKVNEIVGNEYGSLPMPDEPLRPEAPKIETVPNIHPTSPSAIPAMIGGFLIFLCLPIFSVNGVDGAGWGLTSLVSGILLVKLYVSAHSNFGKRVTDYNRERNRRIEEYNAKIADYKMNEEIIRQKYLDDIDYFNYISYLNASDSKAELFELLAAAKVFLVYQDSAQPVLHPRGHLVKRGKSEASFLKYLKKYFSDDVTVNTTFILDGKSNENLVLPDYVIHNKRFNISLDIEIDEPYVMESGMPIHYLGADDRRDKMFTKQNWVVIRFAEEQIVLYPNECCYYIAEVLSIISVNLWQRKVNNRYKKLPQIPLWDEEEALQMAKDRVREKYDKSSIRR